MKQSTISVVISAFNEEKNIKNCLESVRWVDEIIFVDNSSSDKTVSIARKYTKNIFIRENNVMLNINKNFGISKAKGEWIFVIDADEIITNELKREIKEVIKEKNSTVGYKVPRKNIIFGKWIEHTGWYPDHQMRMFKNGKGRFAEKHVHEQLIVEGAVAVLEEALLHNNYTSVAQFIYKHATIYAPNEAEQRIAKGYTFNWQDAIRFPVNEFLSRYFARSGYKDGLHGLVLSLFMGFYHFIIFAYIWEKNQFPQVNDEVALETVKNEFKHASNDFHHWVNEKEVIAEKNPIKRISKKIQHFLQ